MLRKLADLPPTLELPVAQKPSRAAALAGARAARAKLAGLPARVPSTEAEALEDAQVLGGGQEA